MEPQQFHSISCSFCYHAGVDGSSVVASAKHPGSDGLHVEVRLTLRERDDPNFSFLQLEGHWTQGTQVIIIITIILIINILILIISSFLYADLNLKTCFGRCWRFGSELVPEQEPGGSNVR